MDATSQSIALPRNFFWPNHPFTVPVDAAKVDGLVWFH